VRQQPVGQTVSQVESAGECAESVTGLARQETAGDPQRVEYLEWLPARQLAGQDVNVDVGVVSYQDRCVQA
jgi:hypothetical protein